MDILPAAGLDYVGVRESFILQRGQEIQGVPVTIIQDDESENFEAFQTNIEAGSPLPARISLNPAQGSISIEDVPFVPTRTVDTRSPTMSPSRMFHPYYYDNKINISTTAPFPYSFYYSWRWWTWG